MIAIYVPTRPVLGERYESATFPVLAENGTVTVAELVLEPEAFVAVTVIV